jgi:aryl-alcohol dehydrogenase-like predicted oxidoreductase
LSAHPTGEIAPGYRIPGIVKGGWQLAGGHGEVDAEAAIADMRRFVDAGITCFDCADIYTGVEEMIGRFLARYRSQAGSGAAAEVRVHTKLVPDLADLARLSRADVERIVDRSRARLGMDTLDMVQLAWWDYEIPGWVEAALHLVELRRRGKLRLIGATNFDTPRLRELLEAGVPVVAHQVQYSPVDRRPERGMLELCRERGVALLCYGSLLGGLLSDRYLGASEPVEPFENRSLRKYALVVREFGGWVRFQTLLRALRGVADRHRASIARVALRWTLDQPGVAAAIVGARHARHLEDVGAALRLSLAPGDHAAIQAAVEGAPGPEGDCFGLERVKGGPHARIMRYDLNRETAG